MFTPPNFPSCAGTRSPSSSAVKCGAVDNACRSVAAKSRLPNLIEIRLRNFTKVLRVQLQ
jgi:hypothetical protein